MNKEAKICLSLFLALIMFLGSAVIQKNHPELGIFLYGASIFIAIYVPLAHFPFERAMDQDPFRHEPMPPIERREVTIRHRHEHHNYNFNQVTVGSEISKTLPDGSKISVRHVKKWDS
jgi:hypothetical protein